MGGGDSKPNPPPSRPVPRQNPHLHRRLQAMPPCRQSARAGWHDRPEVAARVYTYLSAIPLMPLPSRALRYETWYYWDASGPFYSFTAEKFADVPFPEHLKGT
jgi:hypothetical protein